MQPDGHRPRLFFYVQHLLGIGHLHRAAQIAKAAAGGGFEVRLLLGGLPSPGLPIGNAVLVQLPPVKAGPAGFSALVHPDGTTFDAAARDRRTAMLLDAFDAFEPDVLVIEAFPFGRRQMRFELLPLLDRAKGRSRPPLIAASVRDILQREARPERVAETVGLVDRFFDLVLVHGDPRLVSLAGSYPHADRFAGKVVHTGLVAPEPVPRREPEHGAVVSVGGGAVGGPLLSAALAARPLTAIAGQPWLVLTGPNLPPEIAILLERDRTGLLQVERFVPNLAQVLARASVSVSQAGYNTVADILAGGCRAVLVPFARGGETEQGDRASLLEKRGAAVVVREKDLTPERLAVAIDAALTTPPAVQQLSLDGAAATAQILLKAFALHRIGEAPQPIAVGGLSSHRSSL